MLLGLIAVAGFIGPVALFGMPAAARGAAPVELRTIDRATVRVFAVRGVTGRWVRSRTDTGRRRFVASADVSRGTGVVISGDGLVMTAKSVVARAPLVGVMMPGSDKAMRAHVLYKDPSRDVAFLRIDLTGLPFVAPAAASALKVTERVSASGYPSGSMERLPAAMSGEISRLGNDGRVHVALPMSSGMAGAAVVDAQGRIVGLVSQPGGTTPGALTIIEPLSAVTASLAAGVTGKPDPEPFPLEWDRQMTDIGRWAMTGALSLPLHPADAATLRMLAAENGPEVQTVLAARMWNAVQSELDRQRARSVDELPSSIRTRAKSQVDAAVEVCDAVRTRVAPAWRFADQAVDGGAPKVSGFKGAGGGPAGRSREGILPVDGTLTIHILSAFSPVFGLGVGVGGHAGVFRYGREGGTQLVVSAGATATITTTLSDFGDVTMTGSLDIGLIGRFGAFQLGAYYAPGFNLVFDESAWSWEGFRVEFGSSVSSAVSYGTAYLQTTSERFGVIQQLSGYLQIGF